MGKVGEPDLVAYVPQEYPWSAEAVAADPYPENETCQDCLEEQNHMEDPCPVAWHWGLERVALEGNYGPSLTGPLWSWGVNRSGRR